MRSSAIAQSAEWYLFNGDILSVDENFSRHTAIAIDHGRITAVGSAETVEAWISAETKKVDLGGRTVIPGLIDNHNHLLLSALASRGVDLSGARSIEELQERLRQAAEQRPNAEVIFTSAAWHEAQLNEKRLPTRQELDAAVPKLPVYVMRGGHSVILNSKALEEAGVNKNTSVPEGGKISRHPETGELTGEIVDSAIQLVNQLLPPPPSDDELLGMLNLMAKKMVAAGYTSLREPGLVPEQMLLYQRLWEKGELPIRISMMLRLSSFQAQKAQSVEELLEKARSWGVRSGFGNSVLRLDAIKLVADGGFEGGLMSEPYAYTPEGDTDFHGIQVISTEKLQSLVTGLNEAGWRIGTHAVGDQAIDIVLDAYEATHREKSIRGNRWTLEHAMVVRPDQLERMKNLGLVISTQHHSYLAASSMIKYWGEERASNVSPVKKMMEAGLIVGGGTDWPVIPYNPFEAIFFWVTRDTISAGVLHGSTERLTRQDALQMHTLNNAYLTFEEDLKGSLEKGKLADLVVLNGDFMSVPAEEIKDIQALATMINGEWQYISDEADFIGAP